MTGQRDHIFNPETVNEANLGYRPNIGIVLVNDAGRVFVGKRTDQINPDDGWQMPQGGIDPGESAADALWRELQEEIGTRKAELVANYPRPLTYDFPEHARSKIYDGKFRGQSQLWFLLRFLGDNSDIHLSRALAPGERPEFNDYDWKTPDAVLNYAVPFKRTIYENVLYYFDEYIAFGGRR